MERRLFEVLGAWAPEAPEPEAKLLFRVHSFRHARHAEVLDGFEAGLAGLDAVGAVGAKLEEVAEGPRNTQSRLIGAYRVVVPALVARYAAAPAHIRDALEEIRAEDEVAAQEAERLLATLSAPFLPAEGAETT